MDSIGGEGDDGRTMEMLGTWISTMEKFQSAQRNGGDLMAIFGDMPEEMFGGLV